MDTAKEETVSAGKSPVSRFIILIPHRDALKPLYEYRKKLFTAGLCGAHSFPLAAPLASVSRRFTREELRELAGNVRNRTKENGGKILSAENAIVHCPALQQETMTGLSFLGPLLDLPIEKEIFPEPATKKIYHIFSRPVLCTSLVESSLPKTSHRGTGITENTERKIENVPDLSFRVAALANLAIRPLSSGTPGYSFEWKIGPLVWLPKYKEK